MELFLGFCIGYCVPPIIIGLTAYLLAKHGKNYYIPLLLLVLIYIIDSLGRLIISGFALYRFVALCLAYIIMYCFLQICKKA